ncbi:peptidoglycan-binding LysM [Paenibacillus larvae subsp. larvae]|uniref:Peptidoglycan-binding LysM n=2 Tax=Paenibacillus larvae TaxID=1464 RepID=A0A2L1U3I0_9BACL|nr:LysM peptidoglycan-binding domain-containing protein [Paenibacillus larvae]AVF27489.1 peptidoglycan-binding LysM [Paenibacillus larvae subsp. larvae]AVF32152.1 peptidoglycan-binding LysM [Paenibacillus larvae subsp. larvae]MDR5608644.1 LysM peptidoglycan-binding domain-containing protein [Paenibacillus larvae]
MKIHMVKKGESLYSIAQKYNVNLDTLIEANPQIADPNKIDVGMKVKIPSAPAPAELSEPSHYAHKHIVKQGDTLWKLSKAWGIPLKALIDANPQLKNPNILLTGQTVYIPKPGGEGEEGKKNTAPIPHGPGGKKSTAPIEKMEEEVPAMPPEPEAAPIVFEVDVEVEKEETLVIEKKVEPEPIVVEEPCPPEPCPPEPIVVEEPCPPEPCPPEPIVVEEPCPPEPCPPEPIVVEEPCPPEPCEPSFVEPCLPEPGVQFGQAEIKESSDDDFWMPMLPHVELPPMDPLYGKEEIKTEAVYPFSQFQVPATPVMAPYQAQMSAPVWEGAEMPQSWAMQETQMETYMPMQELHYPYPTVMPSPYYPVVYEKKDCGCGCGDKKKKEYTGKWEEPGYPEYEKPADSHHKYPAQQEHAYDQHKYPAKHEDAYGHHKYPMYYEHAYDHHKYPAKHEDAYDLHKYPVHYEHAYGHHKYPMYYEYAYDHHKYPVAYSVPCYPFYQPSGFPAYPMQPYSWDMREYGISPVLGQQEMAYPPAFEAPSFPRVDTEGKDEAYIHRYKEEENQEAGSVNIRKADNKKTRKPSGRSKKVGISSSSKKKSGRNPFQEPVRENMPWINY